MNILLGAVSIAQKSSFKLLHNLALIRLALLMLFLDQPKQSLRLMVEFLPYTLTHAPLFEQGMAQYIMAMSLIAQDPPNFAEAIDALDDAIQSTLKTLQ
jgi:hypothetical protein